MRLLGRGALLVVLWLLAWGDASVANILSGVAVSAVLLVAFPLAAPGRERSRFDVGGVLRLVVHVGLQLVLSNLVMARTILRRDTRSNAGVVDHVLAEPSELVVTLMTSIIALSPGTMTVDVDDHASAISVHFFSLDDPEEAAAVLRRLERLVTGAVATRTAPGGAP